MTVKLLSSLFIHRIFVGCNFRQSKWQYIIIIIVICRSLSLLYIIMICDFDSALLDYIEFLCFFSKNWKLAIKFNQNEKKIKLSDCVVFFLYLFFMLSSTYTKNVMLPLRRDSIEADQLRRTCACIRA